MIRLSHNALRQKHASRVADRLRAEGKPTTTPAALLEIARKANRLADADIAAQMAAEPEPTDDTAPGGNGPP